jgi:sodium/bile acid cotransporter 7
MCQTTLIRSVFSTQFANNAFSSIPPASVALTVALIIILYLGFSVIGFLIARLPFIPSKSGKFVNAYRLTKGETTAGCYCAAAKGLAVGTPMLDVLYGGFGGREKAIISIPFGLYQCEYSLARLMIVEQVIMAQVLTHVFRRWNRPEVTEDELSGPADNTEEHEGDKHL